MVWQDLRNIIITAIKNSNSVLSHISPIRIRFISAREGQDTVLLTLPRLIWVHNKKRSSATQSLNNNDHSRVSLNGYHTKHEHNIMITTNPQGNGEVDNLVGCFSWCTFLESPVISNFKCQYCWPSLPDQTQSARSEILWHLRWVSKYDIIIYSLFSWLRYKKSANYLILCILKEWEGFQQVVVSFFGAQSAFTVSSNSAHFVLNKLNFHHIK